MSEIQRSEIVYEEGWRESAPVMNDDTPVDEKQPEPKEPTEDIERSKPLLISLQLILCLAAALIHEFMELYREELQKPIVSQEVFEAADVTKLFVSDNVTVQATPDETAHSGS